MDNKHVYRQKSYDQTITQEDLDNSDIPIEIPNAKDSKGNLTKATTKTPDASKCYLTVDPSIPDQEWVVLSFVAPLDLEQEKKSYMFNNFMLSEINEQIRGIGDHLLNKVKITHDTVFQNYIKKLKLSKNNDDRELALQLDIIRKDIKDEIDNDQFGNDCVHEYGLETEDINVRFNEYCHNNPKGMALVEQFDRDHEGHCSTTGFKIRGSYKFYEQAKERAEFLSQQVENHIHAYVAPVGKWIPYNPYPDAIDGVYQVKELNNLMEKKLQNQADAKRLFEADKKEKVEAAKEKTNDIKRQELKTKLKEKYAGKKGFRN